jgi:SAM-dependent methyltransferase
MEPYFPLHARVCEQCFLVQLNQYVSPEAIFREYAYFSSYSTSWLSHAQDYCKMITNRLALNGQSLVVEIASNDGYLLQHFLPFDVPVLGVEPARNVAEVAIKKGIPTRTDFFGFDVASQMVGEGLRADLIIGNNVLAQVPDLNDFVSGIAELLKPYGVVTLEFPHLQRLMEESQFDTIYHEHFSYFSLLTVIRLAERHGLKVFDVEELSTHGGSLRVYLAHLEAPFRQESRVASILDQEERFGLGKLSTYTSFVKRVCRIKRNLLGYLIGSKDEGKTICGYGAPGKGNTLLNYCGIGTDFLNFTVDRNPYKHGRFTPGMHIPIQPPEMIDKLKPDYILILPWNLKAEIMHQMQHVVGWGAKFIVPIPNLQIIDPRERLA